MAGERHDQIKAFQLVAVALSAGLLIGAAAGVDRMVMLICGVQNLREITRFPMNQRAEDRLMGAPLPAEPRQLRELALRVVEPPKA